MAVAPFMGAWIEMSQYRTIRPEVVVAPFMGAWIEIKSDYGAKKIWQCRSLHGSVD